MMRMDVRTKVSCAILFCICSDEKSDEGHKGLDDHKGNTMTSPVGNIRKREG